MAKINVAIGEKQREGKQWKSGKVIKVQVTVRADESIGQSHKVIS